MNSEEQTLIDGLFSRLQQAETDSAPRDALAEARIKEHMTRQPAAGYYMTQSILVQEQRSRVSTRRTSSRHNRSSNCRTSCNKPARKRHNRRRAAAAFCRASSVAVPVSPNRRRALHPLPAAAGVNRRGRLSGSLHRNKTTLHRNKTTLPRNRTTSSRQRPQHLSAVASLVVR